MKHIDLLTKIYKLQPEIFQKILIQLSVFDINQISLVNDEHYNIIKANLAVVKTKIFQVQSYEEIEKSCNNDMEGTPWIHPEFLLNANLINMLCQHEKFDFMKFGISSMILDKIYIFKKVRLLDCCEKKNIGNDILNSTAESIEICLKGRKFNILENSGILTTLYLLKSIDRYKNFVKHCESLLK